MAERKKKALKKKETAKKKKKIAAPTVPAGRQVPSEPEEKEELKPLVPPPEEKAAPPLEVKPPKKKEEGPKYYGTGRRKEAVARVWLKPGGGSITINGEPFSDYFCGRKVLEFQVTRPLVVTNSMGNYDVAVEVWGGGIPGQAGAVTLGVARALTQINADFKSLLKKEGLLTRDPRMKERKKYGRKRARRAFQYTKR